LDFPHRNATLWDLVILGGGAAGMASAIFTQEETLRLGNSPLRILIMEGAKKPGAKILVSGGGRCNVTHRAVDLEDYHTGNRNILKNILRRFPAEKTLSWFQSLGVELKLEETGKWFPVSDSAATVLQALLRRIEELGIIWQTSCRAEEVHESSGQWNVRGSDGLWRVTPNLVLATGGLALPKSGSDGWGLELLKSWGYHIKPTVPALAPLVAETEDGKRGFPDLSGLTIPLHLQVKTPLDGERASFDGSTLFTHFGMSGPAPMNLSRSIELLHRQRGGHDVILGLGIPQLMAPGRADHILRSATHASGHRTLGGLVQDYVPERLATWWVGDLYGVRMAQLSREQRKRVVADLCQRSVRIRGSRGFAFAETTGGGIALEQIDHRTMESRLHSGLYLVGEILDVDGRIGGFNFQWAWASGKVAGEGIARSHAQQRPKLSAL
jgi:predicted Rossmann fold flavoprotein